MGQIYTGLIVLLVSLNAAAQYPLQVQPSKPDLRVAIIDTGFSGPLPVPLCPSGHRDFSDEGTLKDNYMPRHGSNIAQLIAEEAGSTGYCLIILKIFSQMGLDEQGYYKALEYAATLNVQIVNLSLAGTRLMAPESAALLKLLDKGVTIVAAAGNNSVDFDKYGCHTYPACLDPRIIVVGNSGSDHSNHGHAVDLYVDGANKLAGGTTLTGTSQSTAIVTGRIIKQALQLREKGF